MNFNLDLINTPNAERVTFTMSCRVPHSYGSIIGIIDTGSPKTIISAKDVLWLKLRIEGLESVNAITGFGRGSLPCKRMNKFKFVARSADGCLKDFCMPVNLIDVLAFKHISQDYLTHAYNIPTIIGLDFLKQFGLKAHIDLKNSTAYLELED